MHSLFTIIFGPWLFWLPVGFFWAILLLAALRYASSLSLLVPPRWAKWSFRELAWLTAGFRVAYAALLTVGQYLAWSQNELTRSFLTSRVPSGDLPPIFARFFSFFGEHVGYFFIYASGRWWLNIALSIAIAFAFFAFLRVLERHNPRFFNEGEVELGLLVALLVGWPGTVVLLPLLFGSIVLVSLYRMVFLGESYTTLGMPLLLAGAAALFGGHDLVRAIGLGVLLI